MDWIGVPDSLVWEKFRLSAIRPNFVRQCILVACRAGPCRHLKTVKLPWNWENCTLMHLSMPYVCKKWRWFLGSRIDGILQAMFWGTRVLKFDFRKIIVRLMSVNTVVGNVSLTILRKFCVSVSFFLSLFFFLLLRHYNWRKAIEL